MLLNISVKTTTLCKISVCFGLLIISLEIYCDVIVLTSLDQSFPHHHRQMFRYAASFIIYNPSPISLSHMPRSKDYGGLT